MFGLLFWNWIDPKKGLPIMARNYQRMPELLHSSCDGSNESHELEHHLTLANVSGKFLLINPFPPKCLLKCLHACEDNLFVILGYPPIPKILKIAGVPASFISKPVKMPLSGIECKAIRLRVGATKGADGFLG